MDPSVSVGTATRGADARGHHTSGRPNAGVHDVRAPPVYPQNLRDRLPVLSDSKPRKVFRPDEREITPIPTTCKCEGTRTAAVLVNGT